MLNGLNAPTKRHKLAEWIKNQTCIYAVTRDPLQTQEHIQTESEGWKTIFHANGNQKKAVIATLISDKIDFKINNVTRDKKE